MESLYCHADGSDSSLSIAGDPVEMFALEFLNVLDFLHDLRLDHFALVAVLQPAVELADAAAKRGGGLGVVQSEVAFLNGCVCLNYYGCAGGGVHYFGLALRLSRECLYTKRQGQAVDGLRRRVGQEVGNVVGALLVFEDGALAGEGEFPETEAFSQRKGGVVEWWSGGVLEGGGGE
jgi:hypothetical protein